MRRYRREVAGFAAAVLIAALVAGDAIAADGLPVTANAYNVAAGCDASNNTLTCNFSLTPKQLREVTKAAAEGATEPLIGKIGEISKRLGITEEAAKMLLRVVGEQTNVPDERLADVLNKVANDYKWLQVQVAALNPDNPRARDHVEHAKSEIDAGHFAAAHQLLTRARQAQITAAQETDKLAQQAQAARDSQLLGAAATSAAEGDLAMTELHYTEAADFFKEAAGLVPVGIGHPNDIGNYLHGQANALYRKGDERGDNTALKQSIDTWHLVLEQCPRWRARRCWAMTQHDLGAALVRLGERESETGRLEEAVAAFRAALKERTREWEPLDWAMTQYNLGAALVRLGERESETGRLEEAVAIFRAVLKERTRERVPLDWAYTQHALANALVALAAQQKNAKTMEEALTCMRGAAEVYQQSNNAYLFSIASARINEIKAELPKLQR